MSFKKIVIGILSLTLIVGLGFFFLYPEKEVVAPQPAPTKEKRSEQRVIGSSIEGRDIVAHTFGSGDTHLLFVGAIHGGYEWNTALLSYQLIEFFENTPESIPEDMSVSVIPVLNPDGLVEVVGTSTPFFTTRDVPPLEETYVGRFNANNVDLNRNFDCNWAPESSWRGETVSAGTSAFSEPEARSLKDFVADTQPDAAVFFHSKGDAVFTSACNNGVLPETESLMNIYAQHADYRAAGFFDAYPITGDAEGWLATQGIPAITIELASRDSTEWMQNKAGVLSLIEYYSK